MVDFRAGDDGLPSADTIHDQCMDLIHSELICNIIKNIYCAITNNAPEGCNGAPPPCKQIGESCLSNTECCEGNCTDGTCIPPI